MTGTRTVVVVGAGAAPHTPLAGLADPDADLAALAAA